MRASLLRPSLSLEVALPEEEAVDEGADESSSLASWFSSRWATSSPNAKAQEAAATRVQARWRGELSRRRLDGSLDGMIERYMSSSYADYWSPAQEGDANFLPPHLYLMFRLVDEAFLLRQRAVHD